jgi:hypothetical protein
MKCANETVTIELKNGAFMFCACILDFVDRVLPAEEASLVSGAGLNFAGSALAHSKASK